MRIHVLDMGTTKYGDCLLVTHGGKNILIDGGHPGDFNRIRTQLITALDQNPPFTIDLLVVTHCHNDHIGCLPRLISEGVINIQKALVADERLGWGRTLEDTSPIDALNLTVTQKKLVAALQEEDLSGLPNQELEAFFEDITLEEKYGNMLEDLDAAGVSVVRFGTAAESEIESIETEFASLGLKILGPTEEHLLECWQAIANGTDTIAAAVLAATPAEMDSAELADVYRRLLRGAADDPAFATDQPGVGAAKNDQSIVLKVTADGWSAMLAGDMQFARAEVPNLTPLMQALRTTVRNAGPYQFIKLTHHTSYNALDSEVLDEWITTPSPKLLLAHTGGSNDTHHPDEDALEALEARETELLFARTDRNRMITVEQVDGQLQMSVTQGQLNDFSLNTEFDVPPPAEEELARPEAAAPQIEQSSDGRTVEVIARVPHTSTKVTITIQVEPGAAPGGKKKNSEARST